MDWEKEWERFNPYQRAAVMNESRACLVNANVGSGKTTVLISKVLYLHEIMHVSYRDMVVLTFTNKAADEIKERLKNADSSVAREDMELFGTFHGVALKLLKNRLPVEQAGYTKEFLIMEPEEELNLAFLLVAAKKLKIKYKNRLKKRLEAAESAQEAEAFRYQDDLRVLTELLKEEKLRQNKMTFSDLLRNACRLLEETPVGAKWVIVDEVQDCDLRQLEMIERLMEADTKLFAVGDPNQVIYSFRGSAFHIFYTLKRQYQAEELSLPVNYRSSSSILLAARCFKQNGSALEGTREGGEKIVVRNHYNAFQEACCLVDQIRELHTQGTPFSEIAVFYRLQSQSKVLEAVFLKNGIPYEVAVKTSIHETPVLEWLLKLLRFVADPADLESGIAVLSSRDYGIGISAKKAEAIIQKHREKKDAQKVDKKADAGVMLLSRIASLKDCEEAKNGAQEFYSYLDLSFYLKPNSAAFQENHTAVCHFLERLFAYIKERELAFLEGLRDFLNSAALYGWDTKLQAKTSDDEADSVRLMTLHASKGLEFSHVFIIGVNYGLIPLRTKGMAADEEERRLFFVGITRAKDHLEFSWYTSPDDVGVMPGESPYIRLISPGLLERDEKNSENRAADLQEMRREIRKEQEKSRSEKEEKDTSPSVNETWVSHETYGRGRIVQEDDTMVTVDFEGYGTKEFVKAFSSLDVIT